MVVRCGTQVEDLRACRVSVCAKEVSSERQGRKGAVLHCNTSSQCSVVFGG